MVSYEWWVALLCSLSASSSSMYSDEIRLGDRERPEFGVEMFSDEVRLALPRGVGSSEVLVVTLELATLVQLTNSSSSSDSSVPSFNL